MNLYTQLARWRKLRLFPQESREGNSSLRGSRRLHVGYVLNFHGRGNCVYSLKKAGKVTPPFEGVDACMLAMYSTFTVEDIAFILSRKQERYLSLRGSRRLHVGYVLNFHGGERCVYSSRKQERRLHVGYVLNFHGGGRCVYSLKKAGKVIPPFEGVDACMLAMYSTFTVEEVAFILSRKQESRRLHVGYVLNFHGGGHCVYSLKKAGKVIPPFEGVDACMLAMYSTFTVEDIAFILSRKQESRRLHVGYVLNFHGGGHCVYSLKKAGKVIPPFEGVDACMLAMYSTFTENVAFISRKQERKGNSSLRGSRRLHVGYVLNFHGGGHCVYSLKKAGKVTPPFEGVDACRLSVYSTCMVEDVAFVLSRYFTTAQESRKAASEAMAVLFRLFSEMGLLILWPAPQKVHRTNPQLLPRGEIGVTSSIRPCVVVWHKPVSGEQSGNSAQSITLPRAVPTPLFLLPLPASVHRPPAVTFIISL
ncbi:hypothetical protein J6590_039240 [Homalodisca vitripennis]|nr:hypothetical protein J6590_039240 [Homalodisca vitripennis]